MSISSLMEFIALIPESVEIRNQLNAEGSDPIQIASNHGYKFTEDELWVWFCSDVRVAIGSMGWEMKS